MTFTASPMIAYHDLRRALVAVDSMGVGELTLLALRVEEASKTYPGMTDVLEAENAVLRAYQQYVETVAKEQELWQESDSQITG